MNSNKKKASHKNAIELHEKAHEYVRMGKIDQALKMYKQASEIADKIDAPEVKAHALINSAQLLANKGEYNESLSFMEQGIEIMSNLKSPEMDEIIDIYEEIKFMKSKELFEYILKH
jgi:tetratricopeptide (TPR) repeat protein